MTDVLEELAAEARRRVSAMEKEVPLDSMRRMAESAPRPEGFPFEAALAADGMSFICEVKKASPSKGVIDPEFDYMSIAEEYESAGASCISVLTEPSRFLGDIRYLREIASAVQIPVLRKDFVVDDYMVYEARAAGASAVLLIRSILTEDELRRFMDLAHSLGMSALVEVHDADEMESAVRCGARVVGVNNRNLRDFTVDPLNCLRLAGGVPDGILFVAESGVSSRSDVEALEAGGADAVLIGESLMRAPHKAAKLAELRGFL